MGIWVLAWSGILELKRLPAVCDWVDGEGGGELIREKRRIGWLATVAAAGMTGFC